MEHALERLKISVNIAGRFTGKDVNQELLDELLTRTEHETKDMRTFLLRMPMEGKDAEEITLVVRHYQFQLGRMMDKLYESLRRNKATTSWLVKPIIRVVNELLLHLIEENPRYIDRSLKLPDAYHQESVAPRINEKFKKLKECTLQNTDPELVAIVGACLQPRKSFSYNELDYAEKLLNGLEQLREGCSTQELIFKLVEYNLNCSSFMSYLGRRLYDGIPADSSLAEKKEYFSNERKKMRSVFTDAGVGLVAGNDSVREQVCRLIAEEIEIAEKEEGKAGSFNGDDEGDPWDKKFFFNISLDQLGVLIRAAGDAGIIKVWNKTALFRKIANAVRTNSSEHPSAECLRKRSYAPTKATIDAAIDNLHKMISYLRKYLM